MVYSPQGCGNVTVLVRIERGPERNKYFSSQWEHKQAFLLTTQRNAILKSNSAKWKHFRNILITNEETAGQTA